MMRRPSARIGTLIYSSHYISSVSVVKIHPLLVETAQGRAILSIDVSKRKYKESSHNITPTPSDYPIPHFPIFLITG